MTKVFAGHLSAALIALLAATGNGGATEHLSASQSERDGVQSIGAPETVDPGAMVVISVPDGTAGGTLELWGPLSTDSARSVGAIRIEDATATLKAPMQPGSYQLRYVGPDGNQRASRPIEVAAYPVTLSAPAEIRAGHNVEVSWRGPAMPGDTLRIVSTATRDVVSEVPAVGTPGIDKVSVLRAPAEVGAYTLEYRSRDATLRTLAINVSG